MMHVTFNIATQTIINTSLLMNIFQMNLGRLVPSRFSLSMCSRRETRTHTVLWPFFRDYPSGLVTEEIFFWTFMVEDNRSRHIDHPAGCHSIRTNQQPTPIFTPDALPAATVPLYPGLGQATNKLACIPSGVVCSRRETLVINDTGCLWSSFT